MLGIPANIYHSLSVYRFVAISLIPSKYIIERYMYKTDFQVTWVLGFLITLCGRGFTRHC